MPLNQITPLVGIPLSQIWGPLVLDHDSLHLPLWIVNRSVRLDPTCERALFRCTVVEAAAVEFAAFLQVWCELSLYGFQRL